MLKDRKSHRKHKHHKRVRQHRTILPSICPIVWSPTWNWCDSTQTKGAICLDEAILKGTSQKTRRSSRRIVAAETWAYPNYQKLRPKLELEQQDQGRRRSHKRKHLFRRDPESRRTLRRQMGRIQDKLPTYVWNHRQSNGWFHATQKGRV